MVGGSLGEADGSADGSDGGSGSNDGALLGDALGMLLGALLGDEDDFVVYGVGSVVGGKDGSVGCVDGDELGSGDSLGMLLGCEDGCADGVHSSQRGMILGLVRW